MATRQPTALADLIPAPYNPRAISDTALDGLKYSVNRFGDISGLTWNQRNGHIVSGHQRLDALKAQGATFEAEPPRMVLPDGRAFPIRVVDWDEQTERLANIAANSPTIAGEWTDDLQAVLEGIAEAEGFVDLGLDALSLDDILMRDSDERACASPWERMGDGLDDAFVRIIMGEYEGKISKESYASLVDSMAKNQSLSEMVELLINEYINR